MTSGGIASGRRPQATCQSISSELFGKTPNYVIIFLIALIITPGQPVSQGLLRFSGARLIRLNSQLKHIVDSTDLVNERVRVRLSRARYRLPYCM